MADSKDWLEVESFLDQKEREALANEGIVLPPDHMNGYKYAPKVKIAHKHPWEVLPVPSALPSCRSTDWIHRDVKLEVSTGIAYITLNRTDANNALNDSMLSALHDACCELHKRSDIRVVVLRAEGKMFCSGNEPKYFADVQAMTDAENRKAISTFSKLLYYFQSLPQFTIGLVQGSAMGRGVGLVAVCDMVCAVKAARFAVNEVKLGSCPAEIAPFVAQKVGATNAMRILCTAENLTAHKCKEMGLLNEVVEEEKDFSGIVSDVCDKISLCAPKASARSKRLAQCIAGQPLSFNAMEWTGDELASIRVAAEAQEGFTALLAKAKPSWQTTQITPLH